MSTYDDASLVLVPSGYKNGVVFSQKPMDANGQLTFTRASDATRVGPNGLIEKVRTNELTYSNDFSNAIWAKNDASVTSGQSGYDGTNNAWKLEGTTTSPYIYQGSYSVLRTYSIYAKAGTYDQVSIINGGYGQGVQFNLTNGTIVTNSNTSIYSPTITSVGSGWYRVSVIVQSSAPTYGFLIAPQLLNGGGITAGQYIYIQNAQTEFYEVATDYIATTTAAVSVGPVSGTPRLDYLGSDCPRLLLEPQRSNLLTFSEQMTNGVYGKGDGIAITDNATPSPDGYTNADKIYTNTTAGGDHYFNRSPFTSISSSTAYTFSVFAKKAEFKYISVEATIENNSYKSVTIDLSNGNLSSNTFAQTPKVEDYGNGWYRISVFGTSGAAQTSADTYIIVLNDSLQRFYTGDGTSGIYTWGWQLEAGAYATSYIPTLGTSVTRVTDAAFKTGISSLIGQAEGTLYWEGYVTPCGDWNSLSSVEVKSVRFINLRLDTNNRIELGTANLSTDFNITSSTPAVAGTYYKIAGAYKSGQSVLYVNGVQIGTSATTFTTPTFSEFRFNVWDVFDQQKSIAQALLFKTRLTNAQLAELTTL
jgi:hypothetical protein